MIVDGGGMIARAFHAYAPGDLNALVFARGVARSDETRDAEYEREVAMLDAALGRARDAGVPLVYFSGAPIHGSFDEPVREDVPPRPVTRYGLHQARCEDHIRASGAGHLILRLPNVVGPTVNDHQLVPALIRQLRAGRVRVQRHAGRDLVDVEHLVRITGQLLAAGANETTVNVASGQCVPVPELVDALAATLGLEAEREVVEAGVAQHFDTTRLHGLLPELTFADGYWQAVLRRYAPVIAAGLQER